MKVVLHGVITLGSKRLLAAGFAEARGEFPSASPGLSTAASDRDVERKDTAADQ